MFRQASRRQKAERIAGQAWDNLTAAVDSAGSTTRSAKKRAAGLLDDASSRMSTGTKEARRRANNAMDALAGKRQSPRWGWLAAATMAGAALGWLATMAGRALRPRPDRLELPDSLSDEPMMSTRP